MNLTLYWVGKNLLVMTSIKCCLFYLPLHLSIQRNTRAQRKETYLQLYTHSLKLSLKNERTSGIWKNWTEGEQTVLIWPHTKRASAGGENRSWNIEDVVLVLLSCRSLRTEYTNLFAQCTRQKENLKETRYCRVSNLNLTVNEGGD